MRVVEGCGVRFARDPLRRWIFRTMPVNSGNSVCNRALRVCPSPSTLI